jgi:protease YdgD
MCIPMPRRPFHALTLAALLLLGAGPPPLPGVGPADGRVVVNADAAPWNAVARLQIPGVSRCTAVFVGPRTVLTAAHCLWNIRLHRFVPPGQVHVLSGYAYERFLGHSVAASYRLFAGFDPFHRDATRGRDVAVVTLSTALAMPGGWLGFAAAPPPGTPAILGGYNQDRAEVIEADLRCRIIGEAGALLEHDCAGTRGTSGAALLVRGPDGTWRIAGLQVGAFADRGGGVAVPAPILQGLLAYPGASR